VRRVVGVAIAGVVATAIGCFRDASSPPVGASPPKSETVLAFTGLTFNETCDARNSVLSIDSLEVRDRKLGPFAMRGIEAVEMRGVRARLASCPVAPSGDAAQPSQSPGIDEFLAMPVRDLSLGFVSRVSAQPAELVFHDGGDDLLRIEAGRIDLALGSGALQLADGVVVRARDGGELRATSAEWRVGDGTLRVRGPHEFADAAGPRRAAGDGRFALDRSGTLRSQP
jgi:hypothetical protein